MLGRRKGGFCTYRINAQWLDGGQIDSQSDRFDRANSSNSESRAPMEAGKQVALQTKKTRRQQGKPKYGEREEGKKEEEEKDGCEVGGKRTKRGTVFED